MFASKQAGRIPATLLPGPDSDEGVYFSLKTIFDEADSSQKIHFFGRFSKLSQGNGIRTNSDGSIRAEITLIKRSFSPPRLSDSSFHSALHKRLWQASQGRTKVKLVCGLVQVSPAVFSQRAFVREGIHLHNAAVAQSREDKVPPSSAALRQNQQSDASRRSTAHFFSLKCVEGEKKNFKKRARSCLCVWTFR